MGAARGGAESPANRGEGAAAAARRSRSRSDSGWRPHSSHALPPCGPRAANAPAPQSGGGEGRGTPSGSSRADRRAALPVSGRAGLPQPWCFHHAREGKEGRTDRGPGREGGGGTGRRRGRRPGVSPNFDNFPPPAAPPRPAGLTGRGGAQSPARESEPRNQALTPASLENPVRIELWGGRAAEAEPQRPEKFRQDTHHPSSWAAVFCKVWGEIYPCSSGLWELKE